MWNAISNDDGGNAISTHFSSNTEVIFINGSYLVITPQAIRSPELPDGSVFISSAFA